MRIYFRRWTYSNILKKSYIPKNDKIILENWFMNNNSTGNISKDSLTMLCQQTNLNKKQIMEWIYKRRYFQKRKPETNAKSILNDFSKHNNKPDKEEIIHLKQQTGLDEHKIYSYFTQLRFRQKKSKLNKQISAFIE